VCRPCDSEAVAVRVGVTKGAVYVTGTRGGSIEAMDDGIDSVVPIPVMPSGARSDYGCATNTSETEVAARV
jgi:hypothetical protein